MKTTLLLLPLLFLLVIFALSATLSARTWTNSKGQSIEADFVRLEQINGVDQVVLKKVDSTTGIQVPGVRS